MSVEAPASPIPGEAFAIGATGATGATGSPPAGQPAVPASRSGVSSWGGTAALLTAATVAVSLGNYVYSFLVVHLMSARDFSRFSGAQGLMLVLGSGCMAAIPWAMARFIAERKDRRARQEAVYFGLIASALQGLAFAAVAGVILWREAGVAVGVMVAISAFVGSLIAVPVGFLQGLDRIRAITLIRVLEFVVRFASGIVVLLLVSRSAAAALIGYPVGAAVLVAAGLRLCRSGLPPRSGEADTIRSLVRQSGNLGAIQVFLSMLAALDTVAALAAHLGTDRTASYQSAALLGRIPIFLSASIGLAAYVRVVQARSDDEMRERMGQAARLYAVVVIPFTIACLTVPDALVHLLIPSRYSDATALLRFTAVSGAAVGWIDIVSTAHQARARFRPAIRILGAAAVAQPVVLILAGRTAGIWVFAATLVAVSLIAAVMLSFDVRVWVIRRPSLRLVALAAGALLAAGLLHDVPLAWIALILVIAAVALSALAAEVRHQPVPMPHVPPTGGWVPGLADAVDVTGPAQRQPAPRVLIVGDSWAAGLGVAESYAEIVAAALGAEAVLDLSAVSKTVRDTLADEDRIRAFAPDLAVLHCGATESLVLPGPRMQYALEHWGPPSWRGLVGLEPRARYSSDPVKRRGQLRAARIKRVVKRIVLALGGQRRIPLEEYRASLMALLVVLDDVGCEMTFVSMLRTDERLFPGTGAAMADTQAVLETTLVGHPNAVLVDVRDVPNYWDDFLQDNLHLNEMGQRRVAEQVLLAASPRLHARWTAGPATQA